MARPGLVLAMLALALLAPVASAAPSMHGVYVWDVDAYWRSPEVLDSVPAGFLYLGYQGFVANASEFGWVLDRYRVFLVYGEPGDYGDPDRLLWYLEEASRLGAEGVILDVEFWLLPVDPAVALQGYVASLSTALAATNYTGQVHVALTPYLLTNTTLWPHLQDLALLVDGVQWMCYTSSLEVLDQLLALVSGFHSTLPGGPEPVVALNLGTYWPDPGFTSSAQLEGALALLESYNLSLYSVHDILAYREVVLGEDLAGAPGSLEGLALEWVDSTLPAWAWLYIQLPQASSWALIDLSTETRGFNTSSPTGTLWVMGFVLENGTSWAQAYLAYSSVYGARLEVYTPQGLIYASTWSHPRYNPLEGGPDRLTLSIAQGLLEATYNSVYTKSVNITGMLPGYTVTGVFLNMLSSPVSTYQGLIDNLKIQAQGYTIEEAFNTLDPARLGYREAGDDGSPWSGATYLALAAPGPVPLVGGTASASLGGAGSIYLILGVLLLALASARILLSR